MLLDFLQKTACFSPFYVVLVWELVSFSVFALSLVELTLETCVVCAYQYVSAIQTADHSLVFFVFLFFSAESKSDI